MFVDTEIPVVRSFAESFRALREVGLTIRIECPRVDFAQLETMLASLTPVLRRDDGRGLRVTVLEPGFETDVHSHVTIEDSDDGDGYIEVRYDVYVGVHPADEDGRTPAQPKQLLDVLVDAVPQLREVHRGVLSGSFRFPSGEWASVMQLPVDLPRSLVPVKGAVKISGVDLAFEEPTKVEPLLRAFIADYDALEEIAVRVMMRFDAEVSEGLSARMVAEAYEQARGFVRQKTEEE